MEKPLFDSVVTESPDSDLFDTHELKTTKPVKEARAAILEALKTPPGFQVTKNNSDDPRHLKSGPHKNWKLTLQPAPDASRVCVIVGAQTQDDETQIFFKDLEYKAEAVNKLSFGALLGTPVEVKYVPNPSVADFSDDGQIKSASRRWNTDFDGPNKQAIGGVAERK